MNHQPVVSPRLWRGVVVAIGVTAALASLAVVIGSGVVALFS